MSTPMTFATNFLGRVLEKLHLKKPQTTPVSGKDEVWLFDNLAYYSRTQQAWLAEFVAAYFDRDGGEDLAGWVAQIADTLGIAENDESRNRIAERIEPFINAIRAGKTVEVEFGHKGLGAKYTLGPSLDRGVSFNTLRLPGGEGSHRDGEVADSRAVMPGGVDKMNSMKTLFARAEGWGVISGGFSSRYLIFGMES